MSYKILLSKILDEIYVDDFLNGNLYLNTDNYFAEIDGSDALRSDINEGADAARQIKEISIQNDSGDMVPIGGVQNPLIYRYGSKEAINVLCMFMFTDQSHFSFDERNLNFGNTAILIKDAKEFVKRFKSAAYSAKRKLSHGPVEYVHRASYDGVMGPFKKFSEYSYQNEFRFVLHGGDLKPVIFPIGSIRDICTVCDSSELPNFGITNSRGWRS